MKKLIKFLIAAFIVVNCLSMLGCGNGNADVSNSKYIGTWEATKATVASEETTVEEVLDGPFIVEFKGDGTADATMGQEKITATWTETGKGVKTKGESDKFDLTFTDNDGTLETSVVGMHFYLEKK